MRRRRNQSLTLLPIPSGDRLASGNANCLNLHLGCLQSPHSFWPDWNRRGCSDKK